MWIELALTGLTVALLPLAIIWLSSDTDKYRKLAWVTLFLTFDLVMFGAFTRLTDSGLGCPDWPGCYARANPLQAHTDINAAEAAMPTGPVTLKKAWIEMIHRYLAMAVGILIVFMVAVAASVKVFHRLRPSAGKPQFSLAMPLLLLGAVCVQGAFGAFTVTMKLQPVIVTTHLLLGMTLLGLLAWHAARLSAHDMVAPGAQNLPGAALFGLLLLALQIALGGWVSTNYATLACGDFPLCHGSAVPDMDFADGFTLWRHLGKTAAGDYLPFPALTAIHWTHRMMAFAVIAYLAWLGHRALKTEGLRKTGGWLLIVIAAQFATGASTIFLQFPLLLAVAHNGGAALLLVLLVMLNYKARIPAARACEADPVAV